MTMSFFEAKNRKKQILWALAILGLGFTAMMISSYFSESKKPAPIPQTTSSTQIRWFLLKRTLSSIKPSITIVC